MLQVTARAKKGAILGAMKRAQLDRLAGREGEHSTTVPLIGMRVREAVARLLPEVANGSEVQVQYTVTQDPMGGWGATLLVGVTPPLPGKKERR